jgi:hypothetical protein
MSKLRNSFTAALRCSALSCSGRRKNSSNSRQVAGGDERPEPPTRIRRLGVDQPHRPQARVADHCVPSDHAAAVVSDDGDRFEFEEVDDPLHGRDVLIDRHRGAGVEPTRPRRRQVDHVAGDVIDEVRQQRPEGGAADRPAVHEQHVGTRPDAPARDGTGRSRPRA